MIFQVERTSAKPNEKPYKDCFPLKIKRVDVRRFHSPEEYNRNLKDNWFAKGTNHRITKEGYIARDFGFEEEWGIRIDSLEELMDFYKNVGEDIIITNSFLNDDIPALEIYDDYRE